MNYYNVLEGILEQYLGIGFDRLLSYVSRGYKSNVKTEFLWREINILSLYWIFLQVDRFQYLWVPNYWIYNIDEPSPLDQETENGCQLQLEFNV